MTQKTPVSRSNSRMATVLVAGFILFGASGCTVITVAGAAVGVAATVAGAAVDVAVGTVKVTAKAGSAVVGAVTGGEE